MRTLLFPLSCVLLMLFCTCNNDVEHSAPAVSDQDSLPFMHAIGINTLISDSGVMRYHMVAEEWDIYSYTGEAATWKFMKGLLMERFDEKFHIDLYVQSDTAYLHRQQLWELRGRVVIRNIKDETFHTEELFWDMTTHEMWSHKFMRIDTPERELSGTEFRSNETMTKYSVSNSVGAFPVSDTETKDTTAIVPIKEEGKADTPPKEEQPKEEEPSEAPAPKTRRSAQPNTKEMRFPPAPDKRQQEEKPITN